MDLLLADGLEDAFLGIAMRFGQTGPISAYDYEKCLEILMKDGMTRDEAIEYFEFNIIGAWVGDGTPIFIQTLKLEEAIKEEGNLMEKTCDINEHELFDKYDLVEVDESFPIPNIPDEGLILIVGPSGSGKTTIINKAFNTQSVQFGDGPLWSEFSSPENAERLLISCGLRSIPTWRRPYQQLSNGEKHRAECAKALDEELEYIDEFSSVVDRDTAKSLSCAISKFYKRSSLKRLVIASCHYDIIEWLLPDHVYDAGLHQWMPRGCLQQSRPKIELKMEPCNGKEVWKFFQKHHYLSRSFNNSSNAWVFFFNDKPVAFTSILAFPNRSFKNAWREHRTVVIPEFQGLGIGNAISDTIGEFLINNGYKYFSKTSHPAMGVYRENSSKWKATSKNKKRRLDYKSSRKTKESGHKMRHKYRVCYSHQYIGDNQSL